MFSHITKHYSTSPGSYFGFLVIKSLKVQPYYKESKSTLINRFQHELTTTAYRTTSAEKKVIEVKLYWSIRLVG